MAIMQNTTAGWPRRRDSDVQFLIKVFPWQLKQHQGTTGAGFAGQAAGEEKYMTYNSNLGIALHVAEFLIKKSSNCGRN